MPLPSLAAAADLSAHRLPMFKIR